MARVEDRGFKYRGDKRTVESVVRRGQSAGRSYDSYIESDVPMLKVKEGELTVRILPPTWEDTERWGDGWDIPVYVHYSVGPDNGTYLCLDKMKGEPCPVCEARRNATDEDEQDQLRVSERRLVWAVDRDNEKAGPQVWSMPASLFKDICSRSVDKKTKALLLIDDPEQGFDIVLDRAGTDKKTKYTGVEVLREESPLHDNEKIQKRWLEFITENSLPDILHYYDADYIEKILYGKAERREDDDDAPRGRRGDRRRGGGDAEAEEPETRSSRRGRGREEEETETETRSSRRGRDKEEETDEGESRRSRRGASEDSEGDWPTRRRGRGEAEPEEEQTETRSTRRGRSEPEEEERPRGRLRGRNGGAEEPPEEEEETRPRRTAEPRSRIGGLRERRADR